MSGASAGLAVSCPSAYGNVRVAPSTTGLESAISFSRNPNHTFTNRGDTWIVGHNVFGGGDRNFAIARFGPNAGNALTIWEDGTVNVIGALNVAGVAAQRIPYVSCRVDGSVVNNRGGQITPSSTQNAGVVVLTLNPPHPAGANFVPQVTLISEHGYVYVDPPASGSSLTVTIANVALAPSTLSFFLTIL